MIAHSELAADGCVWAMCTRVRPDEAGYLHVTLEISPLEAQHAGKKLTCALLTSEEPSPQGLQFLRSFRVEGRRVHDAVGSWARVMVICETWGDDPDLAVRFVRQSAQDGRNARIHEAATKDGQLNEYKLADWWHNRAEHF